MNLRCAIGVALLLSVLPGAASAQPKGAEEDEIELEGEGDDGAGSAEAAEDAKKPAPKPAPDAVTPTASDPRSPDTAAAASAAPDDPAPPGTPLRGFTWEPFGYLRMQYRFIQNDPNVEFVGRDDGFQLQNARVGIRGRLNDRAAFVIQIDGAVDERLRLNDPQGQLRVGLRDAYADLVVTGRTVVRSGFFQTMVDPESLVGDVRRYTIDRPIESRGVRATEGFETPGLTPGRSLGAALRLDPIATESSAIGFELAVQNGADEYASNNDNDVPAVSGSLLARFANESWFVGSLRFNPRSVGELPFRQDETDLQATAGLNIRVGAIALNIGSVFQRTMYQTTGGPASTVLGGHGQLFFVFDGDHPMAFGYRFGILDPSSLIVTDRVMEHTAAATVGVPGLRMRFQFQLTHAVEQSSRALSNSRAQVAAEVSL